MPERPIRTIAITSGKGGVGKTNLVAGLAVAMRRLGRKVMIFDADLGLSNIDVLLHLAPRYTIQHFLNGEKELEEIIIEGPLGIKILPASSGIQELTNLDEFQRLRIIEGFDSLRPDIDVLLIDTPAGISENVGFFCTAAEDIVVITSPEPTAITDAYAIIKVLFTRYQEKDFHIVVNSAKDADEAFDIFRRLSITAERFLNISLDYTGFIPMDESVRQAVMAQRSVVDLYPNSPASKAMIEIAERLLDGETRIKGGLQFFIRSLFSHSLGRELPNQKVVR